jgi:hypothetical protein
MSLLRNKTAEEIVSFIQGWLLGYRYTHNDEINGQNVVFSVLRDILVYACPNGFGKTDDKQETTETANHIPTHEELIGHLTAHPMDLDLRFKSNNTDVMTMNSNNTKKGKINVKESGETSEDYNMTFEEAQAYCSKRGINIPWNGGDIYIDERELTRSIGNVLKWADEHPKVELPKDKRMSVSDQVYAEDLFPF